MYLPPTDCYKYNVCQLILPYTCVQFNNNNSDIEEHVLAELKRWPQIPTMPRQIATIFNISTCLPRVHNHWLCTLGITNNGYKEFTQFNESAPRRRAVKQLITTCMGIQPFCTQSNSNGRVGRALMWIISGKAMLESLSQQAESESCQRLDSKMPSMNAIFKSKSSRLHNFNWMYSLQKKTQHPSVQKY